MDKKNFLIGMLLLFAAFTIMFYQSYQHHQRMLEQQGREVEERADEPGSRPSPADSESGEPSGPEEDTDREPSLEPSDRDADTEETGADGLRRRAEAPPPSDFSRMVTERRDDDVVLENEFVRVTLTREGGAIRNVAITQRDERGNLVYPEELESDQPQMFNEDGHAPALAILGLSYADPRHVYRVTEQTDDSVTFILRVGDSLGVERSYQLVPSESRRDPNAFTVKHRTTFFNLGEGYLPIDEFGINLGTAGPSSESESRIAAHHLTFGHYDGNKARFIGPHRFRGGGFLDGIGLRDNPAQAEIGEERPLEWGTVKNQFFAAIITPRNPAIGYVSRPYQLTLGEDGSVRRDGITGELLFDLRGVAEGEHVELELDYYVGPKEFRRLEQMDERQDLIMQFGFVGFLSKILLMMMIGIQGLPLVTYGIAIVITTVIIKAILWPLTAKVARGSKRMAKIAEPMKELREKYKDNPQKMQMETMKLFRENKVNPFAGCLPIFIQLPIFFALFRMLQSSAELRFESFLWVNDLSAPDTVATIFGLPLNIMPILMGLTMFLQMKMMPMTTTNPMQQKVFLFMPPVITIVLYNFSSGLCLYWTVNNILTILQQFLINRQKDDDFEVVIPSDTPAKKVSGKKGPPPAKKKKK